MRHFLDKPDARIGHFLDDYWNTPDPLPAPLPAFRGVLGVACQCLGAVGFVVAVLACLYIVRITL